MSFNLVCGFMGNYWYKCPNCRTSLFRALMKIKKYETGFAELEDTDTKDEEES